MLDIKLEKFMKEEYDAVVKTIKSRKTESLDEISPEVWNKNLKFYEILLQLCNTVYT